MSDHSLEPLEQGEATAKDPGVRAISTLRILSMDDKMATVTVRVERR